MKAEITGNRDASYSIWHRNTLTRKHTNVDNDLLELSNQTVYTMYYNFDSDGDLIPKVIFETKGLIKDEETNTFILPDLSKFTAQIKAIRGTAKGNNIPAFMTLYSIENSLKFFVVIPLNDRAKGYIKYKAQCFTEYGYVELLEKISGIPHSKIGSKTNLHELNFKSFKFQQTLNLIP